MVWTLKKNLYSRILTIVGLIVGVLLIIVLGSKAYWLALKSARERSRIDPATYQAVFLQEEQLYFGKLREIESQYPVLEDVYYVKLVEDERANSGQLVKLGQTEPHGPTDEMILNRDSILFWENLKPDSQIVQTIRNLKLNQ